MNFEYDINKIQDPILREALQTQINEAKKSRGDIIKSKEGLVKQIYSNLALLFYCNFTNRTANKEYWKQEVTTQFMNFFDNIVSSNFDTSKMISSTNLYNYSFRDFDIELKHKISDENNNAITASTRIGYSHELSKKLYDSSKNFVISTFSSYFSTKRNIAQLRTYIINKLNSEFK